MKSQSSKNLKGELESLKSGWLRTQADFENYRRRIEQEKASWTDDAKAEMLSQLMPILDNLSIAISHAPEKSDSQDWISGIVYIGKQLNETLDTLGIERVDPEPGEMFDPAAQEAIGTAESKDVASGCIMKTETIGYKIKNKIIRPARVLVAK